MLHSGDLNFSFSGLKTAVLTLVKNQPAEPHDPQTVADIARAFLLLDAGAPPTVNGFRFLRLAATMMWSHSPVGAFRRPRLSHCGRVSSIGLTDRV